MVCYSRAYRFKAYMPTLLPLITVSGGQTRHGQALSRFAEANYLIVGISVAVTQGAPVFVLLRAMNEFVIYGLLAGKSSW